MVLKEKKRKRVWKKLPSIKMPNTNRLHRYQYPMEIIGNWAFLIDNLGPVGQSIVWAGGR